MVLLSNSNSISNFYLNITNPNQDRIKTRPYNTASTRSPFVTYLEYSYLNKLGLILMYKQHSYITYQITFCNFKVFLPEQTRFDSNV